jgi:hypothetical protein
MLWLVMTEIGLDGARPIDARVTRSARTLRTIERTTQSLTRVVFEPAHQVVHDFANHLARGFQSFAWNRRAQGDEVRDKVNIRFQSRKKLGFEHESLQIEPLECIFLEYLYDGCRKNSRMSPSHFATRGAEALSPPLRFSGPV